MNRLIAACAAALSLALTAPAAASTATPAIAAAPQRFSVEALDQAIRTFLADAR